jgi:hypothetical protein
MTPGVKTGGSPMNLRSIGIASSLLLAAFAVACGESSRRSPFGLEADPTTPTSDAGAPTGFGGEPPVENPNECGHNNPSNTELDTDYDGDGYALKDDCNECNTSINKGAHDIPGNGIDEDCSGTPDDEEVDCDGNIDLETTNPFDGAKALGLCKKADPTGREWGVIEAKWVKPDGKALSTSAMARLGYGVLPGFGVNAPQAGASMLAISSGFARSPVDPDWESGTSQEKNYSSGAPDGYPKESPACPGVTTGDPNDGVGLQLKIRVPSNAKSFSYQQFFFTFEYPQFICTEWNDFFVTILDPKPADLEDGNIAFDQDTNPISVNNSLFQVCKPGTYKGKNFSCPQGTSLLKDTGFEDHGGTGWLTTTAPVEPGTEITLLFTVWDSGDNAYDSTVLIDDFKFSIETADTTQTTPTIPK